MATDIKPTKDAVFKIIFGSSSNTESLKSLVESVIGRTIENVEILNPYVDVRTIKDKQTILDVKARAWFKEHRETYNIEIQVKTQEFFHNRSLYYWAQSYGTQLKKTETYDKLRKHICINFLNFDLLDHGKFLSKYVILEEVEKTPLTDHLDLYFVQMPLSEYNKGILPENGTLLEKWVYFLVNGDQISDQEASKLNPAIEHAFAKLGEIQRDNEILEAIKMREKDDLANVIYGKRLILAEQIEDLAKDAGLNVRADLKNDLIKKDEGSLKMFVKQLYSKTLGRDELRNEIEGFLK